MAANVVPVPEAELDQNANWTDPQGRSPHDQKNVEWAAARSEEMESNRALKNTLGLLHGEYSTQLASLPAEERAALVGLTADEIAVHLDTLAESERRSKETQKRLDREQRDRQEAEIAARETPLQVEARQTMKAAFKDIASLDERIADLQRLNFLRADISSPDWDSVDAETWKLARENGLREGWDSEIANLQQEKQVRLQEAALHQDTYYAEGGAARAAQSVQQQAPPQRDPAVDRIITMLTAPDGQRVPISEADVAITVKIERDKQAHNERVIEARQRIPNFDQPFENARQAMMKGIDVPLPTPPQVAFIHSFDNGPDIAHHLITHPADADALRRMPHREAEMAIKLIATTVGKRGSKSATQAPVERKTTSAPKPPSPVSGTGRGVWSEHDEGGSADEWFRNRNEQLRRRAGSR